MRKKNDDDDDDKTQKKKQQCKGNKETLPKYSGEKGGRNKKE